MGVQLRIEPYSKAYDVVIDHGILDKIEKQVAGRQVVIISDPLVYKLYGNKIKLKSKKVNKIIVPRGEKYKTISTAIKIWNQLAAWKFPRDGALIALGGGVIGDLCGFVASTYMRGVNLIQIPTTLLSQVDASIGGKTGVNHPCCKNMIGSFYQPDLVWIDTDTLKTLPQKEIKNGLSEIVKYGVIKSTKVFEILEKNAQAAKWEEIISYCVEIKGGVVEEDERETEGERMVLNFGHTIGHAIESLTKYQKISHGEAVAIGMAAETIISSKVRVTFPQVVDRILKLIKALGLPTSVRGIKPKQILSALEMDKKVRDGRVKMVLPVRIGAVVIRDDIPSKIILDTLEEYICK